MEVGVPAVEEGCSDAAIAERGKTRTRPDHVPVLKGGAAGVVAAKRVQIRGNPALAGRVGTSPVPTGFPCSGTRVVQRTYA